MKNMSFSERNRFFVLAHGEEAPTDSEWNEYLSSLGRYSNEITSVRVLVVSKGGGPTMAQRKRLRDVVGTARLPRAVSTSSAIARTIVTLIGLTSPEIAAFSPDNHDGAYRHLGFEPADSTWLGERVAQLQRELTPRAK